MPAALDSRPLAGGENQNKWPIGLAQTALSNPLYRVNSRIAIPHT